MSTVEVRLPGGVWKYDPGHQLGPRGGFGAVYAGTDEAGGQVAVKRLHINAADAAHRELSLAQDLAGRTFTHVMPVLDAGQDANSDGYFVIMPVAEQSLQDYLNKNGPLGEAEAADVLLQITQGLEEANHIVHRDLKPGNILAHGGLWKIADFGIARFVEDSTSLQTLKEALSPQFAAPEQWNYEHATAATDIYALGCIAYALLTGQPPFTGTPAALREGHLRQAPPPLGGASNQMRGLVALMLRKSPEVRPPRPRVREILLSIQRESAKGSGNDPVQHLAAAAAAYEQQQSEAEAERQRVRAEASKRAAIAEDAKLILREISTELRQRVTDTVPGASILENSGRLEIRIAGAVLKLSLQTDQYSAEAFPHSKWDVICGSVIVVEQSNPQHIRSASLWFTRREYSQAEYRWFEVGYEANPLMGSFKFSPIALPPERADKAHWNAMTEVQTSYHPVLIDGEDMDAFCDRWLHVLSKACHKQLQRMPHSLPRLDE